MTRKTLLIALLAVLAWQESVLAASQVLEFRQTPLRIVCDEFSRLSKKPVIVPNSLPEAFFDLPLSAVQDDAEARAVIQDMLRSNGFCLKESAASWTISRDCVTQAVERLAEKLVDADYQLKHALPEQVISQLDTGATVKVDVRLHALRFTGTEREVERALKVAMMADKPLRQIQLEALITEVTISSNDQSAVNLFQRVLKTSQGAISAGQQSGPSQPVNLFSPAELLPTAASVSGAGSLWLTFKHINLDVLASVLSGDSHFNIVSKPIVRVLDGAQADLVIGESRPYVSSALQQTVSGFASNGTVVASQVTYIDTATELHVSPRIADDGRVDLKIQQAANEFAGSVSLPSGDVPIVAKRTINTTVSALSGETIVLGGLVRHEDSFTSSGLPVVRKLPVVGRLFDERNKSGDSSELLVFIKSTVIE